MLLFRKEKTKVLRVHHTVRRTEMTPSTRGELVKQTTSTSMYTDPLPLGTWRSTLRLYFAVFIFYGILFASSRNGSSIETSENTEQSLNANQRIAGVQLQDKLFYIIFYGQKIVLHSQPCVMQPHHAWVFFPLAKMERNIYLENSKRRESIRNFLYNLFWLQGFSATFCLLPHISSVHKFACTITHFHAITNEIQFSRF